MIIYSTVHALFVALRMTSNISLTQHNENIIFRKLWNHIFTSFYYFFKIRLVFHSVVNQTLDKPALHYLYFEQYKNTYGYKQRNRQ